MIIANKKTEQMQKNIRSMKEHLSSRDMYINTQTYTYIYIYTCMPYIFSNTFE